MVWDDTTGCKCANESLEWDESLVKQKCVCPGEFDYWKSNSEVSSGGQCEVCESRDHFTINSEKTKCECEEGGRCVNQQKTNQCKDAHLGFVWNNKLQKCACPGPRGYYNYYGTEDMQRCLECPEWTRDAQNGQQLQWALSSPINDSCTSEGSQGQVIYYDPMVHWIPAPIQL